MLILSRADGGLALERAACLTQTQRGWDGVPGQPGQPKPAGRRGGGGQRCTCVCWPRVQSEFLPCRYRWRGWPPESEWLRLRLLPPPRQRSGRPGSTTQPCTASLAPRRRRARRWGTLTTVPAPPRRCWPKHGTGRSGRSSAQPPRKVRGLRELPILDGKARRQARIVDRIRVS